MFIELHVLLESLIILIHHSKYFVASHRPNIGKILSLTNHILSDLLFGQLRLLLLHALHLFSPNGCLGLSGLDFLGVAEPNVTIFIFYEFSGHLKDFVVVSLLDEGTHFVYLLLAEFQRVAVVKKLKIGFSR